MSYAKVDQLLSSLVSARSFPGAVAMVGDSSGLLHSVAVGAQTYDAKATPMSVDATYFDVASLTKVTVTTTATMLLYQWGALELQTPVTAILGPSFAATDPRKAKITIEHLLLHEAGYPPDPTPVSYCAPSFACPETLAKPAPQRSLTFSCQARAFAAVMSQPLVRPAGVKYVYSDLSMITQMYIVGHYARAGGYVAKAELLPECARDVGLGSPAVVACYYEAFARKFIFAVLPPAGPSAATQAGGFMGFRLPKTLWGQAAPTWNDTATGFPGECVKPYRERVLHGEVSDGNAYALGGVAGHAGLFATGPQLHALVAELLFAPPPTAERTATTAPHGGGLGLNATTVQLFTTVRNASMSSRALGWDTQAGSSSLGLCGNFSAATFTHTGYTGTQICADRQRGLLTILLTNRVYPDADERSAKAIHEARIEFNNAVLEAVLEQRGD